MTNTPDPSVTERVALEEAAARIEALEKECDRLREGLRRWRAEYVGATIEALKEGATREGLTGGGEG